jgi:hypothetical protein
VRRVVALGPAAEVLHISSRDLRLVGTSDLIAVRFDRS